VVVVVVAAGELVGVVGRRGGHLSERELVGRLVGSQEAAEGGAWVAPLVGLGNGQQNCLGRSVRHCRWVGLFAWLFAWLAAWQWGTQWTTWHSKPEGHCSP
jgi:hypothetical protein